MSDPDLPPWTVTAERTVLKDRWIHVSAEDCVTATGFELKPYYLYNFPPFCHVAAVTTAGKVVLVRQYRHGSRDVSLELPGGVIDEGEDVAAGAARELLEETGYAGTNHGVIWDGWANPVNHRNRLHLVLITGCEKVQDAEPEASEQFTVEEVAWPDVAARISAGEVTHPMHLANMMHLMLKAGGGFAPLPLEWSKP